MRTRGLFHLDHLCILQTQRQLIAAHRDLNGVTERRCTAHVDLDTLGDAHIHDAALDGALSVKLDDPGLATDPYLAQRVHACSSQIAERLVRQS